MNLAKFIEVYALVVSAFLLVPTGVHIFVGIIMNGPTALQTALALASIAVHLVVSVARGYFDRNQK